MRTTCGLPMLWPAHTMDTCVPYRSPLQPLLLVGTLSRTTLPLSTLDKPQSPDPAQGTPTPSP